MTMQNFVLLVIFDCINIEFAAFELHDLINAKEYIICMHIYQIKILLKIDDYERQ